ncbi:MAG: sulfotransferase [Caulobacterales bacterium]|nr:sulfotransferase [Caulobacterales bacterium]
MSPSLESLIGQAAQLRRAGRTLEALAAYETLLAAHPNLPDSWYNLALLQRKAGRPEAALASYDQALRRGVSDPEEVRLNRAVILSDDLRREAEAEAELAAALALNPAYVPALLNLGNLHEDRGRRADAAAAYEAILALDPNDPDALARLGGLATPAGPDDPLIGRLRGALGRHRRAAEAALGFSLGRMLDAAGAYDEAFAAYVAANAASRASGTARYDRAAMEARVDALIAAFPEPWTGPPVARTRPPPVFICGMFRSGSTLVEQVLASHARVTAGGELDLIPAMTRGPLAPWPDSLKTTAPATLDALAAGCLATLSALFPAADLLTDKRPDNLMHVGLIKRLFPDAKIVNTVRDPLDNALSVYFLHLDHGMAYALDLLDIGHYQRQQQRLMTHWKALYPDDIFAFDYDAFVADPRGPLERLLALLDLDWDENCLSFHRLDNAVKTASVWQVREPLYQRSSGRSRHYQRQLAPLKAWLEGGGS